MYILFLLFCFAGYGEGDCYELQDPRQFAAFAECNDVAISMQFGPDLTDDRGGRLDAMMCRLSR